MPKLLAILALLAFSPILLFAQKPDSGAAKPGTGQWRQLFNGRDLDGWEHIGPGRFVLENGMLRSEGGMGLLWYTREKFGNCVLRVVYKTAGADSNSGVYVRIADKPKDPWFAVHHGYEVQIDDKGDAYHRTAAIYSLAEAKEAAKPTGEWNTMEINLMGNIIFVTLNGQDVTHFDPNGKVPERTKDFEPERGPRPESGYMGVQNHGDDEPGKPTHVVFKEISVRPL